MATEFVAPGAADQQLHVIVCYPGERNIWQCEVALSPGATVGDALAASGFAQAFPAIDPWEEGVGVFARRAASHDPVADGDRIEIYRGLTFDPMVSRRRRAAHRARPTR
ncbi:RnfH family protein [Schauerella aestuarii]|uniref:RnfH family protein n=1 Tax=Schauerella aestuarii TaxID=2511204 RepID=UPI001371F893|nr:RnfH family protein [Achromobacter aestuarii]MYZ44832.1 RnfH family protein [Achromobacter aestuarii]